MSQVDDAASEALEHFLGTDVIGQPIVYTPKGGAPESFNASIDVPQPFEREDEGMRSTLTTVDVEISTSATTGRTAKPGEGDKFVLTATGETYRVEIPVVELAGAWQFQARKLERQDVAGAPMRKAKA